MKVEYDALMRNKTQGLSTLPIGKKYISCKSIYKFNYKSYHSLAKCKYYHVDKEYAQEEGVDYEETFSPTIKMVTF